MAKAEIRSNGAGAPEPIEALFARLESDVLDPTHEAYGNFIEVDPEMLDGTRRTGITNFWGNFYTYSHVFNIDTNDADLIARLTAAIRKNQSTEAYAQAKVEIADRERRRAAAIAERDRKRKEDRKREARIILGKAV